MRAGAAAAAAPGLQLHRRIDTIRKGIMKEYREYQRL
jgi:hypothetical protein